MRIVDLPLTERPRERLAAFGADALADRELLAVLLGTGGTHGVGAHVLAERLLAKFGSLVTPARAHPAELATVPGMGSAKAVALAAAFELARRTNRHHESVTIKSPLLRGRNREPLVVVSCDSSHRVVACDVVSEGAMDRSLVPVREVVVAVLRRDGRAFALAHNHPSGDPTPSHDDEEATRRVANAAKTVGMRFLDHIIVTDTAWRRVQS